MSDWQRETRADYQRKGFASRSGYGRNPALVIVDFINGFTDPTTPLGRGFRLGDQRNASTAGRFPRAPSFRFSTPRSPMPKICTTPACS